MVSPASLALGQPPGGGVAVVPSVVSLGSSWAFDVSIVQADPGTATFRLNNATQSSATALFISDLADSGVDLGVNLDQLETGDHIYMQDRLDKTKFHLFQVTGAPIDNTSWHEVPIVLVDSGNDFVGGDLVTHNFHLGAADSPELFQTVVANDAELATALTTDGGDTFIKAGAYSVDLDALGALNTTARRFVGAGRQDVTISLTATAPDNLDFFAGKSSTGGVSWENVTLVSIAAAVGPSILRGCFSVKNVTIDGGTLAVVGIEDCDNLVNVVVHNMAAAATSFDGCTNLTNCITPDYGGNGFLNCTKLTNCEAIGRATLDATPDNASFKTCTELSGCRSDLSASTAGATHHGYFTCTQLSACFADGNGSNQVGYSSCAQLAGCDSDGHETNFGSCARLSGCRGQNATANGFDGCSDLSACRAFTTNAIGFTACFRLSGCCASTSTTSHGFSACGDMSACISQANAGDGYNACERVSGCQSNGNTGDGFVDCKYVSSSFSTGDANQFSGSATEAIDLYTNNFQHIITPAALTADVNDFAGLEHASIARMSADALGPWDVNGIAPGGVSHVSRYLRIINMGANTFFLANQNVGSAAANRIITGTGADLAVPQDAAVDLWYDLTTGRWRVVQG